MRIARLLFPCALLLFLMAAPCFSAPAGQDVVLVLDNSGSMTRNDPQRLTHQAVKGFLANLPQDSRAAVVIFGDKVRLALPLTNAWQGRDDSILSCLAQVNFSEKYTDSPAAMERAIYELRKNGRTDAKKSIVFMTDGIVDVGDAARDREKARWLREYLSQEAADAGIRIFGIAFTDEADYELIQLLARKTGGEYFRALAAGDLSSVYSSINRVLQAPPPGRQAPVLAPPPPEARPPALAKTRLVKPPIKEPERKTGAPWTKILAGAIVLGLVALLVIFGIKSRPRPVRQVMVRRVEQGAAEPVPRAMLRDLSGVTGKKNLDISRRITKIGKVPMKEGGTGNHVVIPEKTISRQHAIIEYRRNSFFLVDMESTNGTFLRGKRIKEEARLKHGDIIRFGTFEFEFILPALAAEDETVFIGREND